MGWFENQIEERRRADQQLLEDSFRKIAGVVLGQRAAEKIGDARIVTKGAIDEILKHYHIQPTELPEDIADTGDQLDYCLRPHGIMHRTVELAEGWYRDAFGPILAFTKEERIPVALLPAAIRGYSFTDPRTGKRETLNKVTAARFASRLLAYPSSVRSACSLFPFFSVGANIVRPPPAAFPLGGRWSAGPDEGFPRAASCRAIFSASASRSFFKICFCAAAPNLEIS